MSELLTVKDVVVSFGKLHALDGVTLGVDDGTVTLLIGPNGSGKSTLVNAITGFQRPEKGHIYYKGKEITRWSPQRIYKAGIARTFQIPSLFMGLTTLENLLVADRIHPGESFLKSHFRRLWVEHEKDAVKRALKILEILGIEDQAHKPVSILSGGQMKLVEIGRALMSDAKLYLFDEPISGVNPTLALEIFGKIAMLRKELGVTFFIIEHRLDIALKFADRVNVLASGKLIASGLPKEVVSDPRVIEAYLGG